MSEPLTPPQQDQLMQLIKQQLHELSLQIDSIHHQAEPVKLDQQSIGRVSRIDAIQQQQMAKANERQAMNTIKRLQTALAKMQDDDYGYCDACGEWIGYDRLAIQPDASKCMRCQQHDEGAC